MPLERISIASNGQTFQKGNAPFFYFADTVWSSFTNTTVEEWKEYLEKRESQGFNAVQLNILPQWDRSIIDEVVEPFEKNASGAYNFFKPNAPYFDHAEKLVSMAAEKGMHSALVLLWCNYVPDTWAVLRGLGNIMPFEAISPYVEYVAKRFKPYAPIYLASGDTDFPSKLAISYYAEALRKVKQFDPACLATLHSQPHSEVPDELANMPELDFYMYQSGHTYEDQRRTHAWADYFRKSPIKRPIVNGEPCYDGHKHGLKQGRFGGLDIRRAFFQSLLCGAKAGFTYGAHGLWGWHKENAKIGAILFSGTPYYWRTALGFEGAWDTALCVHITNNYGLQDLNPMADTHENVEPWFLAADDRMDHFALYLPVAVPATLPFSAAGYDCDLYMLDSRRIGKPKFCAAEQGSILIMPEIEGDALILGKRRA